MALNGSDYKNTELKLLALLTFLSLSLFGAKDSAEIPLPKLSVVQVENTVAISPKFLYTVSAKEGEFRVLKGIYLNRQNLDGIQASLVTPAGDTLSLEFPEISADSLVKGGARSTSLHVSPESPFSAEFDMLSYWKQFQENIDTYIGPYPGTYKIRLELGWSQQNWKNLIASGILRGWDTKLLKQSLFSEWVSFTIDEDVFMAPYDIGKPRKIEHEGSRDYSLFVVQNNGLISQEWLIDRETNSTMLVVNHHKPVEVPTSWEKSSLFFAVYPLDIKKFDGWIPIDSVSATFTGYSKHQNKRENLQEFGGHFVSGKIAGEVYFRFPFKQHIQKVIQGSFKQGKMDGKWLERELIVKRKQTHAYLLTEQFYKHGAKNGLCREFYPQRYDGGLKKEAIYLNDKINGTCKFYYQNGQLSSIQNYLPAYLYASPNHSIDTSFQFPIGAGTQIKHGEFLGYFEDGSLRHRINYKENVPVGDCEFYYRYGKNEYHTEGSFKKGKYFEGTFVFLEQVKHAGYGRQLPYYNKLWILQYDQGNLSKKELVLDTSKDPMIMPK